MIINAQPSFLVLIGHLDVFFGEILIQVFAHIWTDCLFILEF